MFGLSLVCFVTFFGECVFPPNMGETIWSQRFFFAIDFFRQDAMVVKWLAGMWDWQQSVFSMFSPRGNASLGQQVKNLPTSRNNNHPTGPSGFFEKAVCLCAVLFVVHGEVELENTFFSHRTQGWNGFWGTRSNNGGTKMTLREMECTASPTAQALRALCRSRQQQNRSSYWFRTKCLAVLKRNMWDRLELDKCQNTQVVSFCLVFSLSALDH